MKKVLTVSLLFLLITVVFASTALAYEAYADYDKVVPLDAGYVYTDNAQKLDYTFAVNICDRIENLSYGPMSCRSYNYNNTTAIAYAYNFSVGTTELDYYDNGAHYGKVMRLRLRTNTNETRNVHVIGTYVP